jgi:hypothetical protein
MEKQEKLKSSVCAQNGISDPAFCFQATPFFNAMMPSSPRCVRRETEVRETKRHTAQRKGDWGDRKLLLSCMCVRERVMENKISIEREGKLSPNHLHTSHPTSLKFI